MSVSAVRRTALMVFAAMWLAGGHGMAAPPAAPFKPRPLSAFERRKAELLLSAKLSCLGCHELKGSGGRIAPSLTDVAARRSPDYILAMITNPQGVAPGTIMPRLSMNDGLRELIVNYLLQPDGSLTSTVTDTGGRAGAASPPPGTASPTAGAASPRPGTASPTAGDAAALYDRFCGPCHGARGGGDGVNAAFLAVRPTEHASRTAMSTRSDDALFDTIFSGGYVMNRSNFMPPFGATLTRDQIWGLVRHIRALCRCEGPSWSRDNAR
jgi:mono/diheme cytochrome c family protein